MRRQITKKVARLVFATPASDITSGMLFAFLCDIRLKYRFSSEKRLVSFKHNVEVLMMYVLKSMVLTMLIAFSFSATALAGGDAANGKKLFNGKTYKCKVCHKLTSKNKVGPGLKDITSIRSEAWLVKWLTDPKKIWEENDAETQEMKKWKKGRDKAKKTKMRMKKNPSGQEVIDIIAFLKKNDEK